MSLAAVEPSRARAARTPAPAWDAVLATPMPHGFCRLGVRVRGGAVVGLEALGPGGDEAEPRRLDPTARRAVAALMAYFEDPARGLDVPVAPAGTAFQLRVWAALRRIPPGGTLTYGALAAHLGTGARAVGGACRSNPVPLLVPCHRVVAAAGPGGFGGAVDGAWPAVKRWLLAHEGALA